MGKKRTTKAVKPSPLPNPEEMQTLLEAESPDTTEVSDSEEMTNERAAQLRNELSGVRIKKDREREAEILEELQQVPDFINVRIPVSELQKDGYGCSKKMPSKWVNRVRISHEQGIALGRIHLGMTDFGEKTADGNVVSSKERVIKRLLELVYEALK